MLYGDKVTQEIDAGVDAGPHRGVGADVDTGPHRGVDADMDTEPHRGVDPVWIKSHTGRPMLCGYMPHMELSVYMSMPVSVLAKALIVVVLRGMFYIALRFNLAGTASGVSNKHFSGK